jgi:hypothetical protein
MSLSTSAPSSATMNCTRSAIRPDISAEAVQLCDHDGASAATRFCEGSSKLRASVEGNGAFAGLDLDELACDLEPLGGSEAHHMRF